MYHTYVMGVDNSIYELEQQGFIIEREWDNFKVSFPEDKAELCEEFIKRHLEVEYWNEYLTEDKVVFLFHLEDGFRRYEVNEIRGLHLINRCAKILYSRFMILDD